MATERAFGRLGHLGRYQGVRRVVRKGKSSREKSWSNTQGPGGEDAHKPLSEDQGSSKCRSC